MLATGLLAVAGSAPAGAQAPATDPYEVNGLPQAATAIGPATRYVAEIAGPADADWYKIRPYEPGWTTVFDADRKEVDISAERLTSACGARSLRITLFNAAGDEVTSAAVYPGTETSILTLRGDPAGHYDLRVDTGLDPACAEPVRYAFAANPYTYIPTLGAAQQRIVDPASCDVYRNKAKKANKQLKRTPKKQKKRRQALIKSRDAFARKARAAC